MVGQTVGGSYCRIQLPLKLALAIRQTVAGRRQGALEGGGGGLPIHRTSGGITPSPPAPDTPRLRQISFPFLLMVL